MTTVTHNARSRWQRAALVRVAGDLTIGFAGVVVSTIVTRWLLAPADGYITQPTGLYALLATLVLAMGPGDLGEDGLGTANRVTLARAVLVLPVSALVWHPNVLDDGAFWWIIAASTMAMILDGVDGWIARRTRSATRFGARFDMELDAFLMLALSVLVWQSGKAGAWVMLIGALRYLFVAAGWVWPMLRATLPASRRRKTICVVQGVVLLVCLGPIIPATLAAASAACALGLLVYSFAVDVYWLSTPTTSC